MVAAGIAADGSVSPRTLPTMDDHDPAGRARLDAWLDPLGVDVRAVRLRPGAGRHRRVLRRLRVRPGGFGQHDRGHRQVRPAALRRLRDARAVPAGREPDRPRPARDAQGLVRPGRGDRELTGHADRRRDGLRVAGRRCRSGSTPGSWPASGSCSVAARARGRSSPRRRSFGRCRASTSSTASRTTRVPPHDRTGPWSAFVRSRTPTCRSSSPTRTTRSPPRWRPSRRGRPMSSTSTGRRSGPTEPTSPARSWRTASWPATS